LGLTEGKLWCCICLWFTKWN